VQDTHDPSTTKGTRGFMAPELLGLLDSELSINTDFRASDVWAAGEITVRLITGMSTFNDVKDLSRYCSNQRAGPSSRLGHNVDLDCRDFVDKAMRPQQDQQRRH
jgi:serine/threonine protein kinase